MLKKAAVLTACLVCARICAGEMSSPNYRIPVANCTSAGSGNALASSSYALLHTLGQFGYKTFSGGAYTISSGMLNTLTPAASTLANAYAYPNPFKAALGHITITFTKLTSQATVKIYTISGELVRTLQKNSDVDTVGWDLRTDAGHKAASGLYLYAVTAPGMKKTGKLIIIR